MSRHVRHVQLHTKGMSSLWWVCSWCHGTWWEALSSPWCLFTVFELMQLCDAMSSHGCLCSWRQCMCWRGWGRQRTKPLLGEHLQTRC